MSDRVTISNLVLAACGTSYVIVDPEQEGREADLLRMSWDITRQATIRGNLKEAAPKWNFATRFFDLAARAISNASPLPYGFAAAYPFGEDHLRLVELTVNGDALRGWKVANGEILAQVAGPLRVEALVDVENTATWDASFTDAFVDGLAARICNALGSSTALKNSLTESWREKLSAAAMVDAREDPPVEQIESDWVMARLAGSSRIVTPGHYTDDPGPYRSLVAGNL